MNDLGAISILRCGDRVQWLGDDGDCETGPCPLTTMVGVVLALDFASKPARVMVEPDATGEPRWLNLSWIAFADEGPEDDGLLDGAPHDGRGHTNGRSEGSADQD